MVRTNWTLTDMSTAMQRVFESVRSEVPPLDFGDVAERATMHRVAHHMEEEFEGWNVDCEYDRNDQVKKSLSGTAGCSQRKMTDEIIPDIIVHHRRETGRENNLLVVELKRNAADDSCDRAKLEGLTSAANNYQYQFGLYINIASGSFVCRWYVNGSEQT